MTGVLMGFILLYVKFENPEAAFTHTLNELRYYINCGIVVLICSAAFLVVPNQKIALIAFLSTIPLHLIFKGFDFGFILFEGFFPKMNYFVRAGWVIMISFSILALGSWKNGFKKLNDIIYLQKESKSVQKIGLGLLFSLILLHIIFH